MIRMHLTENILFYDNLVITHWKTAVRVNPNSICAVCIALESTPSFKLKKHCFYSKDLPILKHFGLIYLDELLDSLSGPFLLLLWLVDTNIYYSRVF